jgi:hypothetical protein
VTQVASPSSRHDDGHGVPYDGEYLLRNTPQRQLPGIARGQHATARGQGFEQVVGWTILGSLAPGSGLIAAGKRGAWVFVVAVTVLLGVVAAGAYLVIDPTAFAASLVGSPDKILLAAGALAALIVGWALVVLATHASARRFAALTRGQRLLSALLVASLIAIVAVPAGYAAQDALLARDTITMVFKDRGSPLNKNSKGPDTTKADPWAGVPRVNVLLMGGARRATPRRRAGSHRVCSTWAATTRSGTAVPASTAATSTGWAGSGACSVPWSSRPTPRPSPSASPTS